MNARQVAEANGGHYISPYNDIDIVAGNGTVGFEIVQQLSRKPDFVFVPVGGGGLISGMAAVIKALSPTTRVIGCQPSVSDCMNQSVQAGEIVKIPDRYSLSDATVGGIEPGSITLQYCMELVDEYVRQELGASPQILCRSIIRTPDVGVPSLSRFCCVEEEEIAWAMLQMLSRQSKLVEPAAALTIAAFLRMKERVVGKCSVLLMCGGNVSMEALKSIV
eukprot:scaffold1745_cov358-Prasinococcus_capsulatus_cf.AAC.6